ncbi:MBOAT family O-acyltransferase [Acetivibrio ethanolgignens]|uniref:Alginate O-acetyltransferase n=1 Tax=Acetivibrio ethanolgignens TaxID=290052 RepID=A0A0V8QE46_9FIRM|nr:MBOAT family O-acyltransferase [Acetivibrio ethanolgignens]KSV58820.1 hypothetical protein ASU35_11595 [Acetivibrio ethanolgignens]
MPITKLNFLFIIIILCGIYYAIPKRYQRIILLAGSMGLYFWFAGKEGFVFLFVAGMVAWIAGISMGKCETGKRRSVIFWIGFTFIFGMLFVFQYSNFVIENLNRVFTIRYIEKTAPIGISFYSLSLLSYIIDVYWKIQVPEKNLGKVLLFGFYFPCITMGPILRYRQVENQFCRGYAFDGKKVAFGMQRVLWGLFKKLVVAERLAVLVNQIYGSYTAYTGIEIAGATFVAAIRLYMDFSSAMDIVLGISSMFGIDLPENFEQPFLAETLAEFWRRWHITLGAWLKDYIYYPVMKSGLIQMISRFFRKHFGKKAGKRAATFLAMFILWVCAGIWHGGAWKYILGFGVTTWFFILLEEVLEPYIKAFCEKLHINRKALWYIWLRRGKTFLMFSCTVLFFFSQSLLEGIDMYSHAFLNIGIMPFGTFVLRLKEVVLTCYSRYEFLQLGYGLIVCIVVFVLNRKGNLQEKVAGLLFPFRWGLYYLLIFSILLFAVNGINVMEGFLYANF